MHVHVQHIYCYMYICTINAQCFTYMYMYASICTCKYTIYPCFNSEQSQVEDGSAFATTCIKRWLPNPFVKLLQDLWPFGQDFKDLGIGGKIYEIVKVQASYM